MKRKNRYTKAILPMLALGSWFNTLLAQNA